MKYLTARFNYLMGRHEYLKNKNQNITALYYKGRADEVHKMIMKLEKNQ